MLSGIAELQNVGRADILDGLVLDTEVVEMGCGSV